MPTDWVVGITTCPRPEPTLGAMMESLAQAGWPELPRAIGFDDQKKRGSWGNFRHVLAKCVAQEWPDTPRPDRFLICQDDVLLTRNMRNAVDLFFHDGAILSLYTPATLATGQSGWSVRTCRPGSAFGALAYVIPRGVAEAILADQTLCHNGAGTDTKLARWCHENHVRVWQHNPSLAWHTGVTSTLNPATDNTGNRQCAEFLVDWNDQTTQGIKHANNARHAVVG